MTIDTVDLLLAGISGFTAGMLVSYAICWFEMRKQAHAFKAASEMISEEASKLYTAYRSTVHDLFAIIEAPGGLDILHSTMTQNAFEELIQHYNEQRGTDVRV